MCVAKDFPRRVRWLVTFDVTPARSERKNTSAKCAVKSKWHRWYKRKPNNDNNNKSFLRYYDSHSLSVHTRTHTGEKPWTCTICNKGFIDSRLLYSHVKVHSSDRPYECHLCKKNFTHQSTLTSHIRTHTGEKPYVCSVCGKSFAQSSNLSLHMRVHSGWYLLNLI